ncbi:4-alpha-glucanotransferase [Ectothiorhodospiraceae bacterium BW-2]|nr:4-alpha-glucanotransferase [Ectothiorhodospiraceae bacterium BW-2]
MSPSAPLTRRRAGVLLHPTSLPSGTLADTQRWLDFMAAAHLGVWQMLPLGIPQHGLSPYQCLSAFAVNPKLYPAIAPLPQGEPLPEEFHTFCQRHHYWLDDYALFALTKQQRQQQPWYQWPPELRDREPATLHLLTERHQDALIRLKWEQFQLHQQWQQLRAEAQQRDILLFGDMPIFVAHDSVDVWAHRDEFLLDRDGMPSVVTGVPPDYFSVTGQRWGNPHFNWEAMRDNRFHWWRQRIHTQLDWFDIVRIDHFRGLEAVWVIDANCDTAIDGYWQPVPGDEMLQQILNDLGDNPPLVAEDLGVITDKVRALKEQFQLPGMSVLQFSFDAFEDNPHKPPNIPVNATAYTGTHDNDTTRGWFDTLDGATQNHIRENLAMSDGDDIVTALITTTLNTAATLAIVPMQDWLGLGSEARMNTPGTTENNWRWHLHDSQLTPELSQWIATQIEKSHRG